MYIDCGDDADSPPSPIKINSNDKFISLSGLSVARGYGSVIRNPSTCNESQIVIIITSADFSRIPSYAFAIEYPPQDYYQVDHSSLDVLPVKFRFLIPNFSGFSWMSHYVY